MLQNNSSKSYPQIILPKNNGSSQPHVNFHVRDQMMHLTVKDFFELTPIINLQNVPDIKNSGLHEIFYNQTSLKMFNIFLYYCIKIDCDIQIEGLDTYYLKELGNLYVISGFNIDISKYARLCSLCIRMEVRKCAHMIYYLIYGRLATNSYISSLISQTSFKKQNKRQKIKKIISAKNIYKKEVDNRLFFNLSAEEQGISIADQLVSDLKQIFHGPIKEKQNSTKTRKHIYQKSDTLQSQAQIMIDEQKDKNLQYQQQANEYFKNYFPKRVLNQQKSAIFQTIYPSFRPSYKFMRKKKFDDTKIQKLLDLTYHYQTKIQKTDQNFTLKPLVNQQKNKNFAQNVLKTSQKFKNTTTQLDRIRSKITKEKRKTQTCLFTNPKPYQNENQRLYLQLLQKSNKIQNTHKIQVTDLTITDYQNENKFINLLRKQQKHKKYPDYDSEQNTQNEKQILEKLSNNQQQNQKRIFHSQCQNRLFKYKNQYRRFMKTHLFNIDNK